MDYKTYHYNDENVNDCGWGCSYRNLQTIISSYNYYYLCSNYTVPSIINIVDYFKKDIKSNNLTELWIEPHDIGNYLKKYNGKISGKDYLFIVNDSYVSKILKTDICIYLEDNIINEYIKLENLIKEHFENCKLPIIIDDGIYSYCIVFKNSKLYLIDPHIIDDNNVKNIDFNFLHKNIWMIFIPSIIK